MFCSCSWMTWVSTSLMNIAMALFAGSQRNDIRGMATRKSCKEANSRVGRKRASISTSDSGMSMELRSRALREAPWGTANERRPCPSV